MNILLINPPPVKEDNLLNEIIHPPLGLATIASVLRNKGYKVKILDAYALRLDLESILNYIKVFDPKVVGLSSTTSTIGQTFSLINKIKKYFPNKIIILGGIHATADPTHAFSNKNIDFITIGEGEVTILELLDEIKKKNPNFKRIKGIGFIDNSKKIILTEKRELISNLDDIPIPAYDLLPLNVYQSIQATSSKLMTMVTSRGCPYHCIFCGVQCIFGHKYRTQSPMRTVDEIEYLVKKFGIKEIHFKDSEFILNPKRVNQICEEIIKRKLKLKWLCNGRVNYVSKDMLIKMKKAGCISITYGVESGNQKIIDVLKKEYKLEDVRKTFKLMQEVGITSTANFIIGSPGETEKDIEDTINFAVEIDPDFANFFFLTPFVGTLLFELSRKNNWFIHEYNPEMIRYHSLIINATKISTNKLKKYLNKAYFRFYFRPKYIFKRLCKVSLQEIKISLIGLRLLIKNYLR